MKIEEAKKRFIEGKPCLVVEFRNSKAERIKWRDKESKQIMEAPLLRHACEAEDGTPYVVNERVDEKFKETEYVQKFKKGQDVFGCIRIYDHECFN